MSNRLFRELELKYELATGSLSSAEEMLEAFIVYHIGNSNVKEIRTCKTIDYYWPLNKGAQFLRVRDSWGSTPEGEKCVLKEVTTKSKDRKTNSNRLELNAEIADVKTLLKIFKITFQKDPVELKKTDIIYFLKDGTVFSVSKVNGVNYLEIEALSQDLLQKYTKLFESKYSEGEVWVREPKSLYELFIE